MSDVFAAAREVMRSLRAAPTASAARSGPTLGPVCLAADRPKNSLWRKTHTSLFAVLQDVVQNNDKPLGLACRILDDDNVAGYTAGDYSYRVAFDDSLWADDAHFGE